MSDDNEPPQPDYVNDLPKGLPPDTPMCQYIFTVSARPDGQEVRNRPCGLTPAMPEGSCGIFGLRCCFHTTRESCANDTALKGQLEQAVGEFRFLGEANLPLADLQGAKIPNAGLPRACLRGANLRGARLRAAILVGADLRGAKLEGAELSDAKLGDADLRHASLGTFQIGGAEGHAAVLQPANLRNARLKGALLSGATIAPEADLGEACLGGEVNRRWNKHWNEYHLQDERCVRDEEDWAETRHALHLSDSERRPTYRDCVALCRQLKLNYQYHGDYLKAGEFYLRERECERGDADQKLLGARWSKGWRYWAWRAAGAAFGLLVFVAGLLGCRLLAEHAKCIGRWLVYHVCGFGERPLWVVYWATGALIFFAFLQGWLGVGETQVVNGQSVFIYKAGPGLAHPFWAGFGAWCTAFYFSVVTFTTLGYGDLRASPLWGRAAAGVEALLGFLLLSLFLVCIVRKFSR